MQVKETSEEKPDFYNPIYYSVVKRPYFRFEFPGLSDIQVNHSQLHQDLFVLSILNGKREGTYLDIGAHEPVFISNTALLEQEFGWRGLGLELDPDMVASHRRLRRNPCLHADALTIDFEECLEAAQLPSVIDYLSLDIDPPANSLAALLRLPHDRHRFRVITFEHDLSFGGARERAASREFLTGLGYQLVVGDVSWADHVVEDWWVDPMLTDPGIIRRMTPAVSAGAHRHDAYFYNGLTTRRPSLPRAQSADPEQPQGLRNGICVEGWRTLNHSYSLVNQWQLLELLRRPTMLMHRDMEPFSPKWNAGQNGSGLPRDLARRIAMIPAPTEDDSFSVIYRISHPMNLLDGPAERLIVFGTAGDWNGIPYSGCTPAEACRRGNLTIATPSLWSKAAFLAMGFDEDRIAVLPHGVAPGCFFPVAQDMRSLYRQVLGLSPADFVLLHLGALTPNKGVDVLLRAFAALKPHHPQLKLVIKDQSNLYHGRGLHNVVTEMAEAGAPLRLRDDHWNDVIVLSENLDLDGLRALYNACDLYVSPYRAEGFNLPPLEAAACGLPIAVTAGGATDDYFTPQLGLQIASERCQHDWGVLLEPDQEALQEVINKVMASPGRWGGASASAWVRSHYSWERIGDRLWELLARG